MNDQKPTKRLSKEDWLTLGLNLLGQHGPEALRIERLCEVAQKTKGSFYHHFEDHDAFIEGLLEYWSRKNTDEIIEQVQHQKSPALQRSHLNTLAASLDHRIEIALRRLAASDLRANKILRQVDTKRISYLASLLEQAGISPRSRAETCARLEYGLYVGFQFLYPDADPDWLMAHGELMEEMIMRPK